MSMPSNLIDLIACPEKLLSRSPIAILLAIGILAGCVPAMAQCVTGTEGGTSHCKVFQTEGGTILVNDLKMFPSGGSSVKVTGIVVNQTNRNLRRAGIKIKVFDAGDRLLGEDTAAATDLNVGAASPIGGHAEGQQLRFSNYSSHSGPTISRIGITLAYADPTFRYVFSMVKPKPAKELRFADEFAEFQFTIGAEEVSFQVANKTDNPMKFDWDNTAYIDTSGDTHKVIHKGIRLIEKEKPQATTLVPPGARLQDFVVPIDYVIFYESLKQWDKKHLLPTGEKAANVKGLSIGLFMPVEVNGKTKNYNFAFRIDDVLFGQ